MTKEDRSMLLFRGQLPICAHCEVLHGCVVETMTLVKSALPDAGSKLVIPGWIQIDRQLARRSRVHETDPNLPEARGNVGAPKFGRPYLGPRSNCATT